MKSMDINVNIKDNYEPTTVQGYIYCLERKLANIENLANGIEQSIHGPVPVGMGATDDGPDGFLSRLRKMLEKADAIEYTVRHIERSLIENELESLVYQESVEGSTGNAPHPVPPLPRGFGSDF